MRGRRPALQAIPGGQGAALSEFPALPAHLPGGMMGEWQRLIGDLQSRKLWDPVMVSAAEGYVTALWMVAECRKAIATDGAFVRTKTGEPKPHPAAGMLSKQLEIVARLAGEFGITPASRSRKGLQGGEGTGDDDAAALGV